VTARIVNLEGVENFRDFGGYRTRGGGRVATGRLYRSAHLSAASARDIAAIADLGLCVVADLRRPREREIGPTPGGVHAGALVLSSDLGRDDEPPHIAFLKATDLSAGSVEAFFLDYYRAAPFEPRHIDVFRAYFAALQTGAGPFLVHCTAGKDRTGLLASLTLHILDVDRSDILADYLLTNEAARVDQRLPAVSAALAAQFNREPSPHAVRGLLGVDLRYLEAALASIEERAGSVDAYLGALGVGAGAADQIRARLTES
jgi:protein-tyrosine phosphatase